MGILNVREKKDDNNSKQKLILGMGLSSSGSSFLTIRGAKLDTLKISPGAMVHTPEPKTSNLESNHDIYDIKDPRIIGMESLALLDSCIKVALHEGLSVGQIEKLQNLGIVTEYDKEKNSILDYNPSILGGLLRSLLIHAGYKPGFHFEQGQKDWEKKRILEKHFRSFNKVKTPKLVQEILAQYVENAVKIRTHANVNVNCYTICPISRGDLVIHNSKTHTVVDKKNNSVLLVNTQADLKDKSVRNAVLAAKDKDYIEVNLILSENPWVNIHRASVNEWKSLY